MNIKDKLRVKVKFEKSSKLKQVKKWLTVMVEV